MLATATKTLVGDVTGTIGASGDTDVERIRGFTVTTPGAGDDEKALHYDHGTGWVCKFPDHGNLLGLTDDDHPQYPLKTGFDPRLYDLIALSFDDGNRRLTVTPTGTLYYFIQGVRYSLSTAKTVDITDTEGLWYCYFVGSTLTASQTAWDIAAGTAAPVAIIYWDATNNTAIYVGWEAHNWVMDKHTHAYLHHTFGTRWETGLGVSINGANLDVSAGEIHDEDIEIAVEDLATAGLWHQDLTPLNAPIFYRSGASGVWRKIAPSTTPVRIVANVPQVNTYSGGTWALVDVAANRYFVYWVLATNDTNDPVWLVPGQEDADTLTATRDGNRLADMAFGNLPTAEHKVLARVIMRRQAGSPYYSLTEVNDYRNVTDEPSSAGAVIGDHGALIGLNDDDHPQYLLTTGLREWPEQGSDPTTPATGYWALYFKAAGLHYIDDGGVVTGPLGGGGATTFLGLTDTPAAYTGQAGKYTKVNAGETALEFGTPGGSSPLTTKGDLFTYDTGDVRLAVGTNYYILQADSATSTGLKWVTLSEAIDDAIGTTRGGILYRGASGWALLAPNTAGFYLKDGGSGADPSWATVAGGYTDPLTTKGDILGRSSSATVRIPVGVYKARLEVDANDANGIRWAKRLWPLFGNDNAHGVSLQTVGSAAATRSGTTSDSSDGVRASTSITNTTTASIGWRFSATGIVEAFTNPHLEGDFKITAWPGTTACLQVGFDGTTGSPSSGNTPSNDSAVIYYNGDGTGNFLFKTVDAAGNVQTTDTGVAFATNTWFDFEVYTDDLGVTWYCRINGAVVATHATYVPTTTVVLHGHIWCRANTSSIRTFRSSRIYYSHQV